MLKPPFFSSSRRWKVPEFILSLSSEKTSSNNLEFPVADHGLMSEPVIIGRPALQHVKIETLSIAEDKISMISWAEYDGLDNTLLRATRGVFCLILSNSGKTNSIKTSRPTVNYYDATNQANLFNYPALLDIYDSAEEENRARKIDKVHNRAEKVLFSEFHNAVANSVKSIATYFIAYLRSTNL